MDNRLGIGIACFVLSGGTLMGCSEKVERIGIIGAMDEEIVHLKESANIRQSKEIASMEFHLGSLGKKEVVVVKCGMGKVNAGICASTLIREFGCAKVINTGVAGSLDSKMDIGDIVVSTDAVQHDYDVSSIGFAKGEIPYTGRYAFPADEALRKAAVEAAKDVAPEVNVHEGRVCSGDQFISTISQKDAITSSFGGLCCEMEGAAIAQACYLFKTPFVVIRAISDKPDGAGAVDFESFKVGAALRCSKIVKRMVESL